MNGVRLIKKKNRRHPRVQSRKTKQQTMDDNFIISSSTYQAQKFALNSYHRVIVRKGKGRRPDPAVSRKKRSNGTRTLTHLLSGKKCYSIDLQVLTQHFGRYIQAVNLVLEEISRS